jgi:hypothetical protein
MGRKSKVVWTEGNDVHSVWATPEGEEDGFLKFMLSTGAILRLQKSSVVKIEEEGMENRRY